MTQQFSQAIIKCEGCGRSAPSDRNFCEGCGKPLKDFGRDVVGPGRYILSFLILNFVGLAVQFFLRRRGWMATWVNLGLAVTILIVAVVVAAIAGSSTSEVDQQFALAHDLAEQGRLDQAVEEYYSGFVLVLGPGGPVEVGDLQKARTNVDKAIAADPENAKALSVRALARLWQGEEPSLALSDVRSVISLDPTLTLPYLVAAQAYNDLGDPNSAIQVLEAALDLSTDLVLLDTVPARLDFYTSQVEFGGRCEEDVIINAGGFVARRDPNTMTVDEMMACLEAGYYPD